MENWALYEQIEAASLNGLRYAHCDRCYSGVFVPEDYDGAVYCPDCEADIQEALDRLF